MTIRFPEYTQNDTISRLSLLLVPLSLGLYRIAAPIDGLCRSILPYGMHDINGTAILQTEEGPKHAFVDIAQGVISVFLCISSPRVSYFLICIIN